MTEESNDLDTLFEFPCSYPVKIFGPKDDDFEQHAIRLVHAELDGDSAIEVSTNISRNDKYLAITVTITATSKLQLNRIYQSLTDDPRVVMAL